MIENQMTVNFDKVWDPSITKDPVVNENGQSDRLMAKHFYKWIEERKEQQEGVRQDGNTTKPFFAQIYKFDSHYPFFNDEEVLLENTDKPLSRVDGMLKTVDKGLEEMFTFLRDSGELENTVIIGTSDHGEYTNERGGFMRLVDWNEHILHALTFMYVPEEISKKFPDMVQNLKHNRNQLVSTLDIYPTIMSFMSNGEKTNASTDSHCLRGYDLLNKKIQSDRVAWSIPGVTRKFPKEKKIGLIALHYGTDSSLYARFGWPKDNGMKVLKYNDIIRGSSGDTTSLNATTAASTSKGPALTMEEWNEVVETLVNRTDSNPVITNSGPSIRKFKQFLRSKLKTGVRNNWTFHKMWLILSLSWLPLLTVLFTTFKKYELLRDVKRRILLWGS